MSDTAAATDVTPQRGGDGGRMPAIYLSHGAPPLADDALWTGQLAGWSAGLPNAGQTEPPARPGRVMVWAAA